MRARDTSTVEILAVRITQGTFKPHSAKHASSEISPGQPALAALVIMSTQSSSASPPSEPALTTNAGRSRKRGASTKGNGTQTISPAANIWSAIVERLAIGVARPFGKGRKIIDERISGRLRPRHHNLITVNIPHHIIPWLKPECQAHSARNSGLRLGSDSSEDHGEKVRDFLTESKNDDFPCAKPSSRLCAFARDNLMVRRALTEVIGVHAKARRKREVEPNPSLSRFAQG